ncbi:MAG: ATP-binding protein, partial [Saprospiraceae bacterium]
MSLAFKNAIFYILLILLSSVLIGFFIYRFSYSIILQSSELNSKHTLEILELKLQSSLDNVRKDVLFISRSPYLKDYIQASKTKNDEIKRNNLTADYVSFLASKPDYAQIRLIGRADQGKEIIRVDRMNNRVNIIGEQELQEKGSSPYFKETIILPEDSVNFSIIDLNKEHGEISLPIMPTLRVSCPIWYNGNSFGIVVINTNLNGLFKELNSVANEEFKLFLIDNKGHAIIHPDSLKQFAFEFKREYSFFKDIGIEYSTINDQSTSKFIRGEKYYFKKVKYPKNNYELVLAIKSNENKLLASFYIWRWSILGITLMIASFMMLIALWWLRKQSKSMQDIVYSISNFEKDLEAKNLPIDRNDEIGIIARTFENMALTIKNNIETLAHAKAEAELANHQKEEFLQNMSHEIRNPLHTILGMTRMLQNNEPRNDQAPIIDSLKFSSSTLLALVNDVLDFAKLKEGRIMLNFKATYIKELLDQIVMSYSYEALSKKISIVTRIDEKLSKFQCEMDLLRFSQVLNNLLSNAIKFSPSNTQIQLQANVLNESKDSINLLFSVIDQGQGIPMEKFDLIKQRFNRLDENVRNSDIGGAGLGLPIVVQILKLHNSKLELESKPNVGSKFSFELELKKVLVTQEILQHYENVNQWRSILIIDDDPQISLLYKHVFSKLKVQLTQLSNIDELIAFKEVATYDILLTDNYLDNDSILNYLDYLKKFLTPRSAQILLTGNHDLASSLVSSNGFFDRIIQKPISPEQLLELVDRVWQWKEFKMPNLSILYSDYDYEKDKISNAINILLSEWIEMRNNLEISIFN